jgi:ABC-type glycerol-3-phosphate transport system permease component
VGALWRILFPIMLPGVVATVTYAYLLREYLFALAFLTQTSLKTMPLGRMPSSARIPRNGARSWPHRRSRPCLPWSCPFRAARLPGSRRAP